MNLAIVNNTAVVVEGEGVATVCIMIDIAIERSVTVSVEVMSSTAQGMLKLVDPTRRLWRCGYGGIRVGFAKFGILCCC